MKQIVLHRTVNHHPLNTDSQWRSILRQSVFMALAIFMVACTVANPRRRPDGGTDAGIDPNSPAKELTSFVFRTSDNPGLAADITAVIDGTNVRATVPFGRNQSLVAAFTTTGARVEVAGATQESGVTSNGFGSPVVYRVFAGNGSTQDYTVTASTPIQQAYVKASNPGTIDGFGAVALSADGNTLAVGAPGEGDVKQNSGAVYVFTRSGVGWSQQAYLKASNAGPDDIFGSSVALSADGTILAVGALGEDSDSQGIDGPDNNNAPDSGAAYIFVRSGTSWSEQAYAKASNTSAGAAFGTSVALSANGDTLAVGAYGENSVQPQSGAAYVFTRSGGVWSQQADLKASNASQGYHFGIGVSLSADGNTLAVGAFGESAPSGQVGSGAAYVFVRSGTAWSQQGNLKASNADSAKDSFGVSVSLSADGTTLAVGARWEDSSTRGIGTNPNNSANKCGAAYVFARSGTVWTQQEYIKASNADAADEFGQSVALSADGNTLAVGAYGEGSKATGIGGDQNDNSWSFAGAVYEFTRTGSAWSQQAYIKASNTGAVDAFGGRVALSADGVTLAVGAHREDSKATGVNGKQNDNSVEDSGAVYLFH